MDEYGYLKVRAINYIDVSLPSWVVLDPDNNELRRTYTATLDQLDKNHKFPFTHEGRKIYILTKYSADSGAWVTAAKLKQEVPANATIQFMPITLNKTNFFAVIGEDADTFYGLMTERESMAFLQPVEQKQLKDVQLNAVQFQQLVSTQRLLRLTPKDFKGERLTKEPEAYTIYISDQVFGFVSRSDLLYLSLVLKTFCFNFDGVEHLVVTSVIPTANSVWLSAKDLFNKTVGVANQPNKRTMFVAVLEEDEEADRNYIAVGEDLSTIYGLVTAKNLKEYNEARSRHSLMSSRKLSMPQVQDLLDNWAYLIATYVEIPEKGWVLSGSNNTVIGPIHDSCMYSADHRFMFNEDTTPWVVLTKSPIGSKPLWAKAEDLVSKAEADKDFATSIQTLPAKKVMGFPDTVAVVDSRTKTFVALVFEHELKRYQSTVNKPKSYTDCLTVDQVIKVSSETAKANEGGESFLAYPEAFNLMEDRWDTPVYFKPNGDSMDLFCWGTLHTQQYLGTMEGANAMKLWRSFTGKLEKYSEGFLFTPSKGGTSNEGNSNV